MKHAKMYYILDTGLTVLNKRISTILNDHIITDNEYHDILEQYENIKQKLYQFDTSQLKEDVKKEILSKV